MTNPIVLVRVIVLSEAVIVIGNRYRLRLREREREREKNEGDMIREVFAGLDLFL